MIKEFLFPPILANEAVSVTATRPPKIVWFVSGGFLSEDGEIKSIKFNDYVSFMQGAKSANSELFKDFCNDAEVEQN